MIKQDWIECELGEVGIITSGGTPSTTNNEFWGGEISWITPADLSKYSEKYISKGRKSITEIGLQKSSARLIPKYSVLFSSRAPIGYTVIAANELCTNQGFKNITPYHGIDFNFVYYFLKSSKQKAELRASGTTFKELSGKSFSELTFPLAPLPIQRAIVSKIEALFSDLDNGIAHLKKAQAQLKIYRQAVLKKAFEGELTKEWRAKQSDLPTAEELLKQIKAERQNHFNQQMEDWKKAVKKWEKEGKVGKKPSKPTLSKEIPDVKDTDIETYKNLPNNWRWSRFGNITYKIGDIDHKMPKTVDNGYPYLSTGNLNHDGTIDFSGAKSISREDFDILSIKIKPEKGDIIFPRYGTIGRNILIDFNREFLVSYSCAIIKNITRLMNPKYALYYSLSPVIKKEIKRYTVETTQANIGIASIENFVFPLCSLSEQTQIVAEIERRLSVCDKMEQSLVDSLLKAEALRQSILKQAFEGNLLSASELAHCQSAPDYEPASELLKKIKSEKLAKEQGKRKKLRKQ
jgi:type I restriction enzyme S subunit